MFFSWRKPKVQAEANVSPPPIDLAAPTITETASFALGWFWGPDSQFGSLAGVVRTRVGYAGGKKKNPTYHRLGDHTEALEIDYDPTKISYEQLLDIFWDSHYPASRPRSRQYMSAIYYHNEEQKKLALTTKDRHEAKLGKKIFTQIVPLSKFYLAEDYHQKYRLRRNRQFMKEFKAIYPHNNEFVNSTAAARMNGYLAGYGTPAALDAELDSFGLSPEGSQKLRDKVYAYHK